MQVSLSGVTAHMFSEHVGNEFRFCTETAAGQVELHRTDLQLTLREVAETRQTGMPEMRRPFSLLFTAECECEFQQGVGVLERTDCGEMEIFVTRVMPTGVCARETRPVSEAAFA